MAAEEKEVKMSPPNAKGCLPSASIVSNHRALGSGRGGARPGFPPRAPGLVHSALHGSRRRGMSPAGRTAIELNSAIAAGRSTFESGRLAVFDRLNAPPASKDLT
jgi:hypothetical protein